jgi:Bacterial protein of unknown function (DUF885)
VTGAFAGWLDRFFDLHWRLRPVDATFVGVHHYDDRLPDASEAAADQARAETDGLLRDLAGVPNAGLSEVEELDRRLAAGQLRIQRWELGSAHFARTNPATLVGEAVFGVMALFLREFGDRAGRIELARARLAAVPALLRQAEERGARAPAAWTERGLRECAGARLLFGRGIGALDPSLVEAAAPALEAVARYEAYLRTEARLQAGDGYACGAEAFRLLLREGHAVDEAPAELARRAEARLAEWTAALWALPPPAADAPATTDPAAFGRRWAEAVEAIQRHGLASWSAWPVRYRPLPEWARDAAPYLYFLPYRAPSAFDPTEAVDSWIPAPATDATIVLNHVVHHGSLGHHLQNWHAVRAASRLGRVAAVDGVARIALFCGGSLAEGWASYAVDLMHEIGFLTPAAERGLAETRVRMAARALVDVRLHHGQLALDEAAALYRDRAGLTDAAARAEVVKNSLFPATGAMYLLGWERLHVLRRAARPTDLRAFHDALLAQGSIPAALVGAAARGPGSAPATGPA